MKKLMMLFALAISSVTANAQYDNYDYREYNSDRYFYDEEFDWHWDIRVRISNGIESGLLTYNESRRLYDELERIERKEYAYQADGYYADWEQNDIWNEVIYLNRRVGIELTDRDRMFYGFDRFGVNRSGFSIWFYNGGYDFYRFDRLGFGSISIGYRPRPNFARRYIYVNPRPMYYSKPRVYVYSGGRGRDNFNRASPRTDNRGRNDYSSPRGNERNSYDNRGASGRGYESRGSAPARRESYENNSRNSRGAYERSPEVNPGRVETPRYENPSGNSRSERPDVRSGRGSETPKATPRNERGGSVRESSPSSGRSSSESRGNGSRESRGNSGESRERSGSRRS